jgi:sulfofructose kinase
MTERVVCVGIAVLDQIYRVAKLPVQAGKHFASVYRECGGGPAANAAVAVARLGGSAELWSRIGADATGESIRRELEGWGVDTVGVRAFTGARSGSSSVLIDDSGERQITAFADPTMPVDSDWLPLERLDGARAVLGDLRWAEGSATALDAARERGLAAVLDADATPAGAERGACQAASHILFSRAGLGQLSGAENLEGGLLTAASRWPEAWIGVTDGRGGVHWLEAGAMRSLRAPTVRAVDTLGAGDVFHGAFALGLARSLVEAEALRFANAAAALRCTRFGAREGFPTAGEVERFLSEVPE